MIEKKDIQRLEKRELSVTEKAFAKYEAGAAVNYEGQAKLRSFLEKQPMRAVPYPSLFYIEVYSLIGDTSAGLRVSAMAG